MINKVLAVFLLSLLLGSCSDNDLSPDHRMDYPGLDDVEEGESLGVVWEEVPGNPRLSLPDCPDWHCLGHTDPWVARGPNGDLKVWFSAGGDLGGPVVGRGLVGENLQIMLSPATHPVLELKEDVWNKHRETVSVFWDEEQNEWIMWYLGYEVSFFEDPGFGQMRTDDPDGIEWERSAQPIYQPQVDGWDAAFITGPTFIEAEDGEWRLYYTGSGTTVGIGLL